VLGTGKGSIAQHALKYGGTLANGKVFVRFGRSHGHDLNALIAGVDFFHHDVVTIYGGAACLAPEEKAEDTHMRHIRLSDYVLNGLAFASAFPKEFSPDGQTMGPRGLNEEWTRLIETSGIGYMANTRTRCPLANQPRANVYVDTCILGRVIPGVPYTDLVMLRATKSGIRKGHPVISLYESSSQTAKFRFECADRQHYLDAGKEPPQFTTAPRAPEETLSLNICSI
jgi:hypothetical protein